jgi:hypothetical protein
MKERAAAHKAFMVVALAARHVPEDAPSETEPSGDPGGDLSV